MCGLAGIISTEKTEFNINHFNILGTLNDERGGDSCGIFIDGKVEYGVSDRKLFRNFTTSINYPKSASIALLHCRKASPGYPVNLDQAQPVVIRRGNKIEFVLMHNGTILNIGELSNKYLPELNTLGMSDSQILAEIIYEHGYDVLEEYTGCTVLIMVDYRSLTPEVLMFKGSSCYNENKTKSERPLVYMINEGKLYFSSMYASLYSINCKKTIYEFPVNKLCRIKDNKVYCIKNINREKLRRTLCIPVYGASYKDNSPAYTSNNLYYSQTTGTYMLNEISAHGMYLAYPSGHLVPEAYASSNAYIHTFYFFYGRLLPNKESYDFLENIDDLFTNDVLSVYCPEVIDYFAYNPRIINGVLTTVDKDFNYMKYMEGSYVTLFNAPDKVNVKDGVSSTTYTYAPSAFEIFKNNAENTTFDFEVLETQILQFITNRLVDLDAVQ